MVDGNQNMIRVWGGGVYEHDVFYDLCDGKNVFNLDLGLFLTNYYFLQNLEVRSSYIELAVVHIIFLVLVWQDFMFGCGQVCQISLCESGSSYIQLAQYPAYDSFLKSIEVEAEQNVKRLRHHPSIVIFGESQSSYGFLEFYSPQSQPGTTKVYTEIISSLYLINTLSFQTTRLQSLSS